MENTMGFFSNLVSAAVKVAITPVAVVKDVVDVATSEDPNNTKKLLKSAGRDIEDAGDDLANGDAL
jgi:hypothetical protein